MPNPFQNPGTDKIVDQAKRSLGDALGRITSWLSFLRDNTADTRHQIKEALYSTSDQVLEKAEETRKTVRLRMAILEIEHHLNRLYPQIGKIMCDRADESPKQVPKDPAIKEKVVLAQEYRVRLEALRAQVHAQKTQNAKEDAP